MGEGTESDEAWFEFQVNAAEHGERTDLLVKKHLSGVGRRRAMALCDAGLVLANGRPAKKGEPLEAGTVVLVRMEMHGRAIAAPDVPCPVLLERDDLVICEKQAGIPSGALPGRETGTLAGALLARFPELSEVGYGPREPGLVHRLDTFTSGLLLAARTPRAFEALREALSEGSIDKRYLALVPPGVLDASGVIESLLGPDATNPKRVRVLSQLPGYRARTTYTVIERTSRCDLVEVRASPAYRHQVRVHLASRGAPLLGDEVYGGSTEILKGRHALHANYIAGAANGVPAFAVESALPAELRTLLESE